MLVGFPCGTLTDFPSSLITTSLEGSGYWQPRATMESYPFGGESDRVDIEHKVGWVSETIGRKNGRLGCSRRPACGWMLSTTTRVDAKEGS